MSTLFSSPKSQKVIQRDEGQEEARADRLRQSLSRREGRKGTVLTGTRDTAGGSRRPRSSTLGGGAS